MTEITNLKILMYMFQSRYSDNIRTSIGYLSRMFVIKMRCEQGKTKTLFQQISLYLLLINEIMNHHNRQYSGIS